MRSNGHYLAKLEKQFQDDDFTKKKTINDLSSPIKIGPTIRLHSGSDLKKVTKIQKNRSFDIRIFNLFLKTSTLGLSENVLGQCSRLFFPKNSFF